MRNASASEAGRYISKENPKEYTELHEDGTFVVMENNSEFKGTYEIKDDQLTLTLPSGQTAVGTIKNKLIKNPSGDEYIKE